MNSIVKIDWLKERLDSSNLVLLDCRFSLANPSAGEDAYSLSHIPGAAYCHLETDLSGPITEHGGRHPLPDLNTFRIFLENAGISNDTTIVAYDNGEGAFAARLWWLMKYVGHQEVYVLDGGFKAWVAADFPISNESPQPKKGAFTFLLQPERLATYEETKRFVEARQTGEVLIDSREPKRYMGLEEPIDKVAGRIPSAINKFWAEGLENGQFKSFEKQAERFADVDKASSVIVYCGSGVTAAPNYLILHELGYQNLKLYLGSYSDWITYPESRVETSK
jgi:thiosulfate/3-mercaptopyruvate sulfurtransferase